MPKSKLKLFATGLMALMLVVVSIFLNPPTQPVLANGSHISRIGSGFWYVVKPGNTLSQISHRYGVPPSRIMRENRINNPNYIWVGQRLWIPSVDQSGDPDKPSGNGTWYVVKSGDTLSSIATKFGISPMVIYEVNKTRIPNPNLLFVGTKIWIPASQKHATATPTPTPATPSPTPTPTPPQLTPTPTPTQTSCRNIRYVVQPGDFLSSIANRFNVSMNAIARANHIINPNLIYVGQSLIIPCTSPEHMVSTPVYTFDYGFNVDPFGTDVDALIREIKDAGFHWVKFQAPWEGLEPSKGQYNWAGLDSVVDKFHKVGLKVLVSITKAPQWARPANADLNLGGPPKNPKDFGDFMKAFAAHYKGRVQAVEAWNEPNLKTEWGGERIDAARYKTLLCSAYRGVKASDPAMVVVSAGLTPTGVNDGYNAVDDVVYLRQLYRAGARGCFDGLGAHPSGYNNPPDVRFGYRNPKEPGFKNHPSFFFKETILRYRNVMIRYGDVHTKIWVTEFGWASSPHPKPGYEYAAQVTPEEQARYLVKALQEMRAWTFIGPAFVWNLNYNQTKPDSEQAQFSVWGRPAYAALKDMPK